MLKNAIYNPKFKKEIKKLKPYLFQITGPDTFTMFSMFLLNKKTPKIILRIMFIGIFQIPKSGVIGPSNVIIIKGE